MQREVISGGSIPGGSESINDWRAFEQGVHWGRRLSHFNFLLERIDEARGWGGGGRVERRRGESVSKLK